MIEEKEMVDCVDQFCKTLKKVGAKRVHNTLTELYRDRLNDYDDKIISFVRTKVCENYAISERDLTKPYLIDSVLVCRSMIIVLVKKHLNLSHSEIADIFKRKGHVMVSHALKYHRELNERIKDDRIFIEVYNSIDLATANYKQTLR